MSEIQLAHFSWGESPSRGRIHDVALRDARIATDHRTGAAPAATRRGVIERLSAVARGRLAFAGSSAATLDACNCPA